jgi:hypothetical protein
MRDGDFSLPPKERAVYGATITARSTQGDTLTLARTNRTAVEAVREICELLDALDDDYRVVSVSTPVTVERDLYASRVALKGNQVGVVHTPEKGLLAQAGRLDMLHPSLFVSTANNKQGHQRKRRGQA